ncbi:hypothetical protein SF23_12450, partial [Streptomyces sp. MBRL 10]
MLGALAGLPKSGFAAGVAVTAAGAATAAESTATTVPAATAPAIRAATAAWRVLGRVRDMAVLRFWWVVRSGGRERGLDRRWCGVLRDVRGGADGQLSCRYSGPGVRRRYGAAVVPGGGGRVPGHGSSRRGRKGQR